jgi:amidase
MLDRYGGRHYAIAQNLARDLDAAYEKAFNEVDILVMPTTPRKATRFLTNGSRKDYLHTGFGSHWNTCPFNVTGHTAINVPCGRNGSLPIGMMLVGRRFEDASLLRAAHAFESQGLFAFE